MPRTIRETLIGVMALTLCLSALSLAPDTARAQNFNPIHLPMPSVEIGEPLKLLISIDNPDQMAYILARYRALGEADARFRSKAMEAQSNPSLFMARIPPNFIGSQGVEYYIVGIDIQQQPHELFASEQFPQQVRVEDETGGIAPVPETGDEIKPVEPSDTILPVEPVGTEPAAEEEGGLFSEEMMAEFELMRAENIDPDALIVSAARRAQTIETSPSAIYVITEEDIRTSGATNIAEVLRMAPGVQKVTVNYTNPNVGIRSFVGQNPNRILTYIDGRSVYQDTLGLTFWQALPISVDDIKRIEVIRGPVSALYGANAANGLINIITKTPEQSENLVVNYEMGEDNYTSAYTQVAHNSETFGFRLSGQWMERGNYDYPSEPFFDNRFDWTEDDERFQDIVGKRAYGRFVVNPSENVSIDFNAGIADGNLTVDSALGNIYVNGRQSHAELDLGIGDFALQTYLNRVDGDIDVELFFVDITDPLVEDILVGPVNLTDAVTQTFDVEATYTLNFSEQVRLLLGLNYRNVLLEADRLDDPKLEEDWYAAFTQFEWSITPKLLLNLAARVDDHPITGTNFSPRGALVWNLVDSHYLRFSAGQAFRNPTMLESTVDITLANIGGQRIGQDGNVNADAEVVTAVELGYTGKFLDNKLRFNAEAFYNLYENMPLNPESRNIFDLIGFGASGTFGTGIDDARFQSTGIEVLLEMKPADWLDLEGTWSYIDVESLSEVKFCSPAIAGENFGTCNPPYNPEFDPVKEKGMNPEETPYNIANVRATLHAGGFTLSGWLHYEGESRYRTQNTVYGRYSFATYAVEGVSQADATRYAYQREIIDEFATINLMASYRLMEEPSLELGVVVENLTDEEYFEYPYTEVYMTNHLGSPTGNVWTNAAVELGRVAYGYLTLKW